MMALALVLTSLTWWLCDPEPVVYRLLTGAKALPTATEESVEPWRPAGTTPRRAYPLILVVHEAARRAGLEAWTGRLAAQVDAESAWRPDAESPYASGLAQFTPGTAADVERWCESVRGLGAWRKPKWQAAAQVCYMERLRRYCGEKLIGGECWRVKWASYNAGPGWIVRERRASAAPDVWAVWSETCLRAARNCDETRGYVRRIERLLPLYEGRGWSG